MWSLYFVCCLIKAVALSLTMTPCMVVSVIICNQSYHSITPYILTVMCKNTLHCHLTVLITSHIVVSVIFWHLYTNPQSKPGCLVSSEYTRMAPCERPLSISWDVLAPTNPSGRIIWSLSGVNLSLNTDRWSR